MVKNAAGPSGWVIRRLGVPLGFISAHAGKQTAHLMFLRWVSSARTFISFLCFFIYFFLSLYILHSEGQVESLIPRQMWASSGTMLYFFFFSADPEWAFSLRVWGTAWRILLPCTFVITVKRDPGLTWMREQQIPSTMFTMQLKHSPLVKSIK